MLLSVSAHGVTQLLSSLKAQDLVTTWSLPGDMES